MKLTIHDIVRFASRISAVSVPDIKGPRRQRIYVRPRMVAAHFAREQGYSYARIGRVMCRDHSTIMNLVQRASAWRGKDPLFDLQMDRMAQAIEAGEVRVEMVRVKLAKAAAEVKPRVEAAKMDSIEFHDWQVADRLRAGSERLLQAMRGLA